MNGGHPGGKFAILDVCGEDATNAFIATAAHNTADVVPKGPKFRVAERGGGKLVNVAGCLSADPATGEAPNEDEKTQRCHATETITEGARTFDVLGGVGDRDACCSRSESGCAWGGT